MTLTWSRLDRLQVLVGLQGEGLVLEERVEVVRDGEPFGAGQGS